MEVTRRKILKLAAGGAAAMIAGPELCRLCGLGAVPELMAQEAKLGGIFNPIEAKYYKKAENKKIQCLLCPRECQVGDKERGFCGARENRDGTYYTLVHSNPCTINLDPIEKKPLFHFLPGTNAFSLSATGCNFDCKFCQNWEISQSRPEQTRNYHLTPRDIAAMAREYGAKTIAYTYGEPTIYYEYVLDCAKAGHKAGIRSVSITNGYMSPDPMKELAPNLDAIKIDFKDFTNDFYRKTCLGTLQPVLDSIKLVKKLGKWLELVVLIIPTLNDDPRKIKEMSKWIVDNVGPDVPVHFSRFQPIYKLKNLPPTPLGTLQTAYETALGQGIKFVYLGNVPGHKAESTFCPKCGKLLIGRYGFQITKFALKAGKCPACGTIIPGVWS